MWTFPILILAVVIALGIPLGLYLARLFDDKLRLPAWLTWPERLLDTGPQNWKQYSLAMLVLNSACFVVGFLVLANQQHLPLNPDNKGALAPSTIFNTVCSFLTNTNLQHYSGEVHLSYFSQIFVILWKMFLTPAIGLAALVAIVRGLRGDAHMGNYYVDTWRGTVWVMLPLAFIWAVLLISQGTPMTLEGNAQGMTLEAGAMGNNDDGTPKPQQIARGPVAAVVAIKQLGTNGGGFFGVNSCHPFENPTAFSNLIENIAILLLPAACVVMFGRMLARNREAVVIGGVMLAGAVGLIVAAIRLDTLEPNPAIAGRPGQPHTIVVPDTDPKAAPGATKTLEVPYPEVVGLPVDQSLGNLEGKELRFGTAAGATWAASTTMTSNGSVNCMHDSLNPLAGLVPLTGMSLNCIFGGVGVGLINLLLYLITGVFLAGLMVGRTPEYLGKKVEGREMKLAMLALLAHPILILAPVGLFAAKGWADGAKNNPAAHGFSETLYEFTSSSANNGSGFEGLGDTYGFAKAEDNPSTPGPFSQHFDIACGLVMLIGRFVPIIAPLALAGSLAAKKPMPRTSGTLRTDSLTFGFVLAGTILLVGALLFLPAFVIGPVAEHLGPMPFGG